MNKSILIGRLTRDPELRFTAGSGTAVTSFTLAINRPKQKDQEQKADFIPCVAFGKTAETIAQYLTKGRMFAVVGAIRTSSYEGNDGTKKYKTEIYVESFTFIDNGKSNNSGNNGNDNFSGASYEDEMTPVNGNDDIPF